MRSCGGGGDLTGVSTRGSVRRGEREREGARFFFLGAGEKKRNKKPHPRRRSLVHGHGGRVGGHEGLERGVQVGLGEGKGVGAGERERAEWERAECGIAERERLLESHSRCGTAARLAHPATRPSTPWHALHKLTAAAVLGARRVGRSVRFLGVDCVRSARLLQEYGRRSHAAARPSPSITHAHTHAPAPPPPHTHWV